MTFLETLAPHIQQDDSWKHRAWTACQALGMPTRRSESFKYVPLKGLYEAQFAPREQAPVTFSTPPNTCVFVNGCFRPEMSTVEGIVCLSLEEATRSYSMLLHKGWTEMLDQETDPFVLLNHALHQSGLFLYVPPRVESHIECVFLSDDAPKIHAPKIELYLGKGAKLTVRSSVRMQHDVQYWHNSSVNAVLDDGAYLNIEHKTSHGPNAWGFHGVRARLKRDATFDFMMASKGAKVERLNCQVLLTGENSEVNIKGLAVLKARSEMHHNICVRHCAPYARSNQHFKNVLTERSRSSFAGKIYVEKEAQKTEAYQLNNNLLLSKEAKAMSQPNLEILADDVKASHGATFVQPKAEEMFYLRTRGLDEQAAKKQLVEGFCRELSDDKEMYASI